MTDTLRWSLYSGSYHIVIVPFVLVNMSTDTANLFYSFVEVVYWIENLSLM